MPSIYVPHRFYDRTRFQKNLDHVRKLAEISQREFGTRTVVLQPAPSREGDKTDDQLKSQAEQLDRIGARLRSMEIIAAYHNLEPDFAWGAREFRHMMSATDPDHVSFCLDVNRVYRGVGKSQLALLDIIKRYGSQVSEIHFRQSRNGHWAESFGDGDIDYALVCRALKDKGVLPHLVYEQAWENGSANTMTAFEAHSKGRLRLKQLCESVWENA